MTSAPATTPNRCISDSTYLTSGSPGMGPLLSGDISPFTLTTAEAQTLQHLLNTVPSGLKGGSSSAVPQSHCLGAAPPPQPCRACTLSSAQPLTPHSWAHPRAKACSLLPHLDVGPSAQWRSSWSAALSLSSCRDWADMEAWPGSLLPRPLPLASVQEALPRSSSPKVSRPRRAGARGIVSGP